VSCPGETTRLLYVEGELSAPDLRSFESHLVTCRSCRSEVVALRDESSLLADVLLERRRASRVPAARPQAPEPGVVIGLPAAIALVTAAFAAIGFLVEASLPGGLDLFNPLRVKGAYEMAFDLAFMLRDRAPGLIELALSLGGLASVSALLTFAAGLLYRHLYGATTIALIALAGAAAEPASALTLRIDEETRVGVSEVVDESMLLTGDGVHVDGVVRGDIIAAADRVTITGTIEGSLYVFARELEITGTVEGNVIGAIEQTRIDGEVKGSLYEVGESLSLGADGRVARDLSLIGERGVLGGRVGRDVVFAGDEIELRSEIGRNVEVFHADRVILRDGTRITGDLDAAVEDESAVERAPGAQVEGEVRIRPPESLHESYWAAYRSPAVYLAHAITLVAAFVFGLLLYTLAPRLFAVDLHTAPQFLRSLGYGFIGAVATPIAIVVLALTVVGIPVAVLTLFVFIVALYTSEIVVASWVGGTLLSRDDDGYYAFSRTLGAGLLLLAVASHIPFVGPPIAVVTALLGLGLIGEQVRQTLSAALRARGA